MINELILASGSPRRKTFFDQMGFSYRVEKFEVEENFPEHLKAAEIALFLAHKKAIPFQKKIKPTQLVVTADTIVWHKKRCLGKPENKNAAKRMLESLSGSTHEVITAVGFLSAGGYEALYERSTVRFRTLSNETIKDYIASGAPFDKAGGYGIQDAFGKEAVLHIDGSYSNVVGLPLEATQKKITEIFKRT